MLKKMPYGILLILLAASVVSFVFFENETKFALSYPPYIEVGPGKQFARIQDAINDIDPNTTGVTIRVFGGTGVPPYSENVVVNKSVIIAGYDGVPIIDGNGTGTVFNVTIDNVTLFNLKIQNGTYGIKLFSGNANLTQNFITSNRDVGLDVCSDNNTIQGNILTANDFGVNVRSGWNFLQNNSMTGNTCNFGISNFTHNNIGSSNRVNGKPIYVWVGEHDKPIPPDAGYVAVVNSRNITVSHLNYPLSNNDCGINFENTSDSIISNVETSHNLDAGVQLLDSNNVRVENVNASYNGAAGITLENSNSSLVVGNLILSNYGGVQIFGSRYNTFVENVIEGSQWVGILDSGGRDNRFYHNNIKANQSIILESFESWDNGAEGNYWSIYTGTDADGDGIGESSFKVSDNNYDDYPLIKQWKSVRLFNVANVTGGPEDWFKGYNITIQSDHIIGPLDSAKLPNETYPQIFAFNLTASAEGGSCNITIPRAWMDGPFNLSLNDSPKNFTKVDQNATYSVLCFTYASGRFQVKITATKSGTIQGDIWGPDHRPDGKVDMMDIGYVAKGFGMILSQDLTPKEYP